MISKPGDRNQKSRARKSTTGVRNEKQKLLIVVGTPQLQADALSALALVRNARARNILMSLIDRSRRRLKISSRLVFVNEIEPSRLRTEAGLAPRFVSLQAHEMTLRTSPSLVHHLRASTFAQAKSKMSQAASA